MPNRASLRNWLHAALVYPAAVFARGEGAVYPALRDLERVQRLSAAEHARDQLEALASILDYAGRRVPFYAGLGGLTGCRADTARATLASLPIVRKSDLQEKLDQLRAHPAPARVVRKVTGGSTGQAVTILKDAHSVGREMAASWMAYGWFGIRIGDRAARFWGSPHSLKRQARFMAADLAMHRVRFSAFAFSEPDLERYWRRCLSFGPQYLYGYVSMLEEFARHLKRRGHDGRALPLKAVITTSEVLSPPQRALLEEVFGAPVQNEYGCGEVGPIAYECLSGKLHVMSQNVVIELIKADGTPAVPGEAGEVVVTDLNNRAAPLIRYGLADYAVWGEPCACGLPFPVLDRIWGRQYDFVQDPSGRRYHGEFLMYFFEELRADGLPIQQFQVVQTSASRLAIRVVVAGAMDDALGHRITDGLQARIPGIEVDVRQVAEIQRAASGKMRVIINEWLNPVGQQAPDAPGAFATTSVEGA